MANPNNAVGTNGAFGGRTSVNAFNDVLATFTGRGVIQGWTVTPSTGLKVNIGGQSGIRDVAIAEDNNGNRTTIDNISQAPIEITMPSAPSTGSRIDLIVGYVENPPQGSSTVIDNPAPTGIITVSGSSSSSPSAPTDSAIRTALTNAGINGTTPYYAVLGSITIPSGTTDISANMIGATPYTNLNTQNNIATGQITADKIDFATYAEMSGLTSNIVINGGSSKEMTGFTNGSTTGNKLSINKSTGKINVNHGGLLMLVASSFQNSSGNAYIGMDILKGSTTIATAYRSMPTSYGGIGPAITYIQAEVGDSFSVKITSPSNVTTTLNAGYASRHYFQAILLG